MTEVIERTEIPQPEPAYALGDLLGVPVPDLGNGEGLPPLWHWVYLLDRAAQADLGPDGHPSAARCPLRPARAAAACGRAAASGPAGRCAAAGRRRSGPGCSR